MISEILACLTCGLYAGAAVYVNLVEQPARLSCGVALAVTEWRPSYKRGTALQAPLAGLGTVLAFFSWWLGQGLSLAGRRRHSPRGDSVHTHCDFPNEQEAGK